MNAPKKKLRTVPQREKEIGKRLAFARELLEISQRSFAEYSGITKARLATYELGSYPLKCDVAFSICRKFNICESWLAEGNISGQFIHPCLFRDLGGEIEHPRPGILFSEYYDTVLKNHLSDRMEKMIRERGGSLGGYPHISNVSEARKVLRFEMERWVGEVPPLHLNDFVYEIMSYGFAVSTWLRYHELDQVRRWDKKSREKFAKKFGRWPCLKDSRFQEMKSLDVKAKR